MITLVLKVIGNKSNKNNIIRKEQLKSVKGDDLTLNNTLSAVQLIQFIRRNKEQLKNLIG